MHFVIWSCQHKVQTESDVDVAYCPFNTGLGPFHITELEQIQSDSICLNTGLGLGFFWLDWWEGNRY